MADGIVETWPDGTIVIQWRDGSRSIQPPLIFMEDFLGDDELRGGIPMGRDRIDYVGSREQLTNRPSGDLMAGKTIEVLRSLTTAVTQLAEMVDRIPGRTRPQMDHIAADLMDVQKALGMIPPDARNPRPKSAWPEGEGVEPRS